MKATKLTFKTQPAVNVLNLQKKVTKIYFSVSCSIYFDWKEIDALIIYIKLYF